jgi:2-dehydro-3-deoxyphosphogluconate aldolase / (4S)-4-hydroxy-2-oxoglutarate aldolase
VNPKTPAPVTAADPLGALGIMRIVPVVVIDDAALRTPAALAALAVIAAHGGLLAGAGTMLEPGQVAQAADAGARFAVSPGFDPDIIEACRAQSLPILPGAATATEIQQVRRAGLRTCKFFPAEACGGLNALTALSGPFPDMRFIPTGGIDPSNAPDYLDHPCVHVIGGNWMVPRELISEGRWDRIRQLCRQAAQIAASRQQPAR